MLPDKEHERNAMKLAQLRERLRHWLPGCTGGGKPDVNSCPPNASETDMCWRRVHVGALLAHVDVLYDLMEGLPAAFVWKIRTATPKSDKQQPPVFPWGTLWPSAPSMPSKKPIIEEPTAPQLLLSKCTVALSSDLTHVEVHHAHEVNLVPLTHVSEVCGGPLDGGTGPLDEWCAVLRLLDGHHLSLRFFKRRQVAPFVAVVLALVNLARDAGPEANEDKSNDQEGAIKKFGDSDGPKATIIPKDDGNEEAPLLGNAPPACYKAPVGCYDIRRLREEAEWV